MLPVQTLIAFWQQNKKWNPSLSAVIFVLYLSQDQRTPKKESLTVYQHSYFFNYNVTGLMSITENFWAISYEFITPLFCTLEMCVCGDTVLLILLLIHHRHDCHDFLFYRHVNSFFEMLLVTAQNFLLFPIIAVKFHSIRLSQAVSRITITFTQQ